jgi:hypothetical protein
MASKLPWMKFFPADWLADAALRSCSFETRGLWIDILCHMHRNDRRGYLQLNGSPVTPEQIARMTGCSADQATRCVAELLSSGVASVLDDGTLYSRRMLREEQKRGLCSEAGQRGGGNPALKGSNGRPLKVVPKVTPKVGPKGEEAENDPEFDPPLKVGPKVGPKVGLKVGPKVPLEYDSSSEEREEEPGEERDTGEGGAGGRGQKPARRRPLTPDDDQGFLAFWREYPRRVKKLPAWKVWQRLGVDDALLQTILDSLSRQKQAEGWLKDNGKFVPHPTTWLNGRQWEDELLAPPQPAARPPVPVSARAEEDARRDERLKAIPIGNKPMPPQVAAYMARVHGFGGATPPSEAERKDPL